MPNYKNAKIYCIRSYQTDDVYIGSTTRKLCQRMAEHRRDFKDEKRYTSSSELLKYDDCYAELIKECPCENIQQLRKIEGEYIRKTDCVNKRVAGRKQNQWKKDNKKGWNEYRREYYQLNKHRNFNCICGSTGSYLHKARHEKSIKHKIFVFNLHNELNHL